jgi:hypothetical protein
MVFACGHEQPPLEPLSAFDHLTDVWEVQKFLLVLVVQEKVGGVSHTQGHTNSRCQVARATTFLMVMPNIFGSSVWNWLDVTFQVPRIFR